MSEPDHVAPGTLAKGAIACALVGVLAAIVFLTNPAIDLAVSGWFADGAQGFGLRFHALPRFFNDLIKILAAGTAVWALGGWILSARLRMRIGGLWARHYQFVFAALVVGPGLIANALFKENWGRARPRTIIEFGGTADFSPPLLVADQCNSNCSFVSGDASMAFFFLAIALLAAPRYRRLAVIAALAFGVFIGFMRLIQGAHFFSDVTFAGVFVCLTVLGLYRLMLARWTPPQTNVPTLSRQLGLVGAGKVQHARSKGWLFVRAKPQDVGIEDEGEA